MSKATTLEWATPAAAEGLLWVWVAFGAVIVLERLLLYVTHRRGSPLARLPLLGGSVRVRHLGAADRLGAIRWIFHRDIRAYGVLLKRYGEVSTALGMTGTLVSLIASASFRSQNDELFPVIAVAVRTTVVGLVWGLMVSTIFGDLLWPRMRQRLEDQWRSRADALEPVVGPGRPDPTPTPTPPPARAPTPDAPSPRPTASLRLPWGLRRLPRFPRRTLRPAWPGEHDER